MRVVWLVMSFSTLVWRLRSQCVRIGNAEGGDPLLIRTVLRAVRKLESILKWDLIFDVYVCCVS